VAFEGFNFHSLDHIPAPALILGEPYGPNVILALALVLAGTWLNFRKK